MTSTNPTCARCREGRNLVNGRFCEHLAHYVEYAKQPPCVDNE